MLLSFKCSSDVSWITSGTPLYPRICTSCLKCTWACSWWTSSVEGTAAAPTFFVVPLIISLCLRAYSLALRLFSVAVNCYMVLVLSLSICSCLNFAFALSFVLCINSLIFWSFSSALRRARSSSVTALNSAFGKPSSYEIYDWAAKEEVTADKSLLFWLKAVTGGLFITELKLDEVA